MAGVVVIALVVFVFKNFEKNQLEAIQQQLYQQQEEPIYLQEIVETDTGVELLNSGNTQQQTIEELVSITTDNQETITKKLIIAGYKPKEISSNQEEKDIPVLEGTKPISIAKDKQLPVSIVLKSTNTLQNKYAEAELPVGIYVKDKNDASYTKEIEKPKFVDPKKYNLDNKEAVAMIDVGSDLESIFFQDEQGNPKDVLIRIPAPGYPIGAKANIYSSEDGKKWKFHTTAVVQNIENSPYVEFSTTHFTLFTVGSIEWDNDNFLTEEFWNNNPTDDQIVRALYGDGSGGIEKTAYTRNWTEVGCVTGNMSVVHLTGGTGSIPNNLAANTIYVLESGNYISTGIIAVNTCSTVIGKTGTINLYSSIYLSNYSQGLLYITNQKYSILDNLKINGTGDGQGGSHSQNYNGIMYYYGSTNHSANNIYSYNNRYGIQLNGISTSDLNRNIFLNNIRTYNNIHGIFVSTYNENNRFENIQSYNNTQNGLYVASYNDNLIFNNIQSYNNNRAGFRLYNVSGSIINNAQIYNNGENGLYVNGNNNILNNINAYNNIGAGIYLDTTDTKLNDISVLNNIIGVQLFGINTGLVYYGKLRFQENNTDWEGDTGTIIEGNNIDYNYLGWTGGYIEDSGCFRCGNTTNPINLGSGSLINTGIYRSCNMRGNDTNWKPDTGEDIGYTYGVNVPKQIQPVEYSGTEIVLSSLGYSGDLYIGEINKIGENTDTTCNNCDGQYSVEWDNDNFVDDTFWSQNPNSCDILAALYGTGKNMENSTIYTSIWTGVQYTPICNPENMQVIEVSPGIDVLPEYLPNNTVYILSGGDYILSGNSTINLHNCNTIITKNGTGNFYSTGKIAQMFYSYYKNNIVLENLSVNGTGDGFGGSHLTNNYGINIIGYDEYKKSLNLVLHNIESFNHGIDSIHIAISDYVFLNNIVVYNNGYGLNLLTSNYNIVYNIQSYNNQYYGIKMNYVSNSYITDLSIYENNSCGLYFVSFKNNFIKSFSVFGNPGRGIWVGGASDSNYFKDGKVYNNKTEGIYLENSAIYDNYFDSIELYNNSQGIFSYTSLGNYFNNIQSYNNFLGIKLYGSDVINNAQIYNNKYGLSVNGNNTVLNNIYI